VPAYKEPTLFSRSYRDGKRNRPDIHVIQNSSSATDFMIANTTASTTDVQEVRASAKKKRSKHYDACNAHGVVFHPYVVSIHGWLDAACMRFTRHIAWQLPVQLQKEFVFSMQQTTSLSLARSRADMITHDLALRQFVSFRKNMGDSEDEDGERGCEEDDREKGPEADGENVGEHDDGETDNERNPHPSDDDDAETNEEMEHRE
jgi:hypothetical protein